MVALNNTLTSASTPALLLFSRSAKAEARHKRLAAKAINQDMLASLIQHARREAISSGLPYFQHTEQEQVGHTFGQKLTHSIQSIFNDGQESLIVMGNDCPNLSAAQLQNIARDLQRHDMVLGPAHNGGLYFIALRKNAFNSSAFQALPWQKSNLQKAAQQYAILLGLEVKWYPGSRDLNNESDVRVFTQKYRHHHLSRLWSHLKCVARGSSAPYFNSYISRPVVAYHGLRAPPAPM